MTSAQTRPRGGQVWVDKLTGRKVEVRYRHKTHPMACVRPHSDMCWTLVAWLTEDGSGGGIMHESDFVKAFAFVEASHVAV